MHNNKIDEQQFIIQKLNGDILRLTNLLKESEKTISTMKRQELNYLRDIDRLNDKITALETSLSDVPAVKSHSNPVELNIKEKLEMLESSNVERTELVQQLFKITSELSIGKSFTSKEAEPMLCKIQQFFTNDKQHVNLFFFDFYF